MELEAAYNLTRREATTSSSDLGLAMLRTIVSNSIEIGNNGATNYGNGSIQIGTLGAPD